MDQIIAEKEQNLTLKLQTSARFDSFLVYVGQALSGHLHSDMIGGGQPGNQPLSG
jgi:hypothetical protein